MNAPDRIPADYQAEAQSLVEWLFKQAAYYRKHAPELRSDIQAFEDAAALIDSYRAGLVLVAPHPAMRAELVRWVVTKEEMPNNGERVLLWRAGDESPTVGHFDGRFWHVGDGFYMVRSAFTHWAKMPAGPAVLAPAAAPAAAHTPEAHQ